MKKNKLFMFFFPVFIVMFLILGIILFPNESIISAKEGISIWTSVLIPSLLPFIIGANLIVDLKIADIIGFIINPITKFIFNVSGKGALVFVISTVSGYPVGSKLASELRINKQISLNEAQRLVAFCSTSGPLFIIGSVATGMFQNPSLGYLMIICHYLGSITVGLLFRNYGKESLPKPKYDVKTNIRNVIDTRYSNGNGFFVSFGNAVFSGVNTLLLIGGFVIVFSVIFKILSLFKIIPILSTILYIPLSFLGITKELCQAFISGLFEMTIGCNNISSVSSPEVIKATLASFLIGFSGLSILAQCCNFIAKTDINTNLYILSKFLHGIFAAIFTFLAYPLSKSTALVSNFNNVYDTLYNNSLWIYYINNYQVILPFVVLFYLISSLYILNKSSNPYCKNT
ncbi:sporulation integral membrane protein YlbJ [Romboutsia maritimum]|uniref:Sporulation integral membrane protein YlbJ n=1 Tax=Romboutsia maritimum TaxID=2020948 RepID=A0A371IWK4_9FIRM|nr:sporulation integral membrane protein YlbJ [Romboutsia maritimum]RDY24861.1 sporulation integral membrane protein YlbJ [Romboutsia maritimum]